MSAGVTVNCVHPGLVYTRTWNYLPGLLQPIFKFILKMFFKVCGYKCFLNVLFACENKIYLICLWAHNHVERLILGCGIMKAYCTILETDCQLYVHSFVM